MKRILLPGLSIVLFILAAQQESKTQTGPQKIVQATDSRVDKNKLIAFNSHKSAEQVKPVDGVELRAASEKALKLIQHAQVVWYKKQACTSCHHQLLPESTFKLARERGVSFDEKAARDTTMAAFAYMKDLDSAVQGYDYIDVYFDGWALTTAHVVGISPSLSTAAYAQFIASRQLPDGSWPTMDDRPPQSHSPFAATAVCAQALRYYLPAQLKDEQETGIRRAREWFLKTQPRTTEDRAFQPLCSSRGYADG